MTVFDSFAGSKTRHGTESGWSKHRNLGEQPCPACCAGKSAADARRMEAPEKVRKNRLHAKAQVRALGRLKNLYPDIYRELYQQAKSEVGL